jgi:hypothetical protein
MRPDTGVNVQIFSIVKRMLAWGRESVKELREQIQAG